jgi:hypothetical protein
MKYLKLSIPSGIKWQGTALQCSDRWHDGSLMRWDQGSMLPIGGWVNYLTPGYSPVYIPDSMVVRNAHSWFLNQQDGSSAAGRYMAAATPLNLYVMDSAGSITNLTDGMDLQGSETPFANKGYGGGKYGAEAYGTPRQVDGIQPTADIPATTWSLDNYGEWLLGVSTTDRNIYRWKPSEDDFGELENSPKCLSLVATEERFIFALAAEQSGTINVRRVAWCDREDPETWVASSTNEAGGFELQTDGAIKCGIRVRGRTLILTTTDAHVATYAGPPLVYGFQQVGKNCGVVSDRAVAATGAGAFWMGRDGFYQYDGSSVRELPCEVLDRVFRFLDNTYWHNVYAVANAKFNEIVWFYTGAGQDGLEEEVDGKKVIRKVNSRYVAYDYAQNHWSFGEIDRHAGIDSGVFRDPIWIDSRNQVFRHEIENAPHGGQKPWAETGPIDLGSGDQVIQATQLLSDAFPSEKINATFKCRFAPQGPETVHGPYVVKPQTDVRFTGRQIRMRIETYAPDPPVYLTWHNQDGTWNQNKQDWDSQVVKAASTVWAPWTNSFAVWDDFIGSEAWEDIEVEPPEPPEEPEPPAEGNPNLPSYGDDLAGTNDVRIGDMRLLITAGGLR